MTKREIVIDITNPYVRSLMMAFEHFMLEECAGYAHSELRLLKEIQKCQYLLDNERTQLVERSRMPIMGNINPEKYQLTFKNEKEKDSTENHVS